MGFGAPYCESPFHYRRRRTRPVRIGMGPDGPVIVGGDHPIRVQSMTTTDTRDTEGTVAQTLRLVEAGCEIVRITAPKVKDAENLGTIRSALEARGVIVPLVADIHFLPEAAMVAADYVDKVRINPGNYADRKVFEDKDYTETEYELELARIDERFSPLVEKCKRLGRAMRIGTNHGSLSDRIMGRYGDTPLGMVESALEFVRICRAHDYHEIVLSMKASNVAVMIEANRLLVARLDELGWDYPLHLGVTEAGDGEDGRIKSAAGIGSLLGDGVGDTIRVSLTEDPEFEIPACHEIIAAAVPDGPAAKSPSAQTALASYDPFDFQRRNAHALAAGPLQWGGDHPPRVELRLPADLDAATLGTVLALPAPGGRPPQAPDGHDGLEMAVWDTPELSALAGLRALREAALGMGATIGWCARIPAVPALAQACVGFVDKLEVADDLLALDADVLDALAEVSRSSGLALQWLIGDEVGAEQFDALAQRIADMPASLSSVHLASETLVPRTRLLVEALHRAQAQVPLLLEPLAVRGSRLAAVSHALGSLLCDGIGDAVALPHDGDLRTAVRLCYNVLQGAGRRITKTEFISCPSCGRTKFDLQTTTERIKSKTGHLKDVRIAIMGCIVNGPGEMADADFGYVGAGTKRISLYVGRDCVERDIPENEADDRLIDLIKRHARWVEPAAETQSKYENV